MLRKSDFKLKEDILSHVEEAFEKLYFDYHKLVMYFAFTRIGDRQEAEDVTQEVFMKIYSNIDDFNPYLATFKTWLVTITRNHVADYLKQRKDFIILDNDIVDNALDEPYFSDKFLYSVRTLEEKERDILVLKVVYSFTHQEIAKALNITIDVSKKKYAYAKKVAKGEWKEYEKQFQA